MGRNSKFSTEVIGNREYFSLEKGSIKKKWKNRVPVALIYPNIYSLGMSNLGFQLVYDLLNQDDSIVAERVFFPESNNKPLSVESGRPLSDFPFLLFSVSFEQDYKNLIMMLELAGISSLVSDRNNISMDVTAQAAGGQPIVVAGGVAAFMNPEPLTPFIDLFIIGEAEPILVPVMEQLMIGIGKNKNESLLKIASKLPGCYVPAFYQTKYDNDGKIISFGPNEKYPSLPGRIEKVILDSPGD